MELMESEIKRQYDRWEWKAGRLEYGGNGAVVSGYRRKTEAAGKMSRQRNGLGPLGGTGKSGCGLASFVGVGSRGFGESWAAQEGSAAQITIKAKKTRTGRVA